MKKSVGFLLVGLFFAASAPAATVKESLTGLMIMQASGVASQVQLIGRAYARNRSYENLCHMSGKLVENVKGLQYLQQQARKDLTDDESPFTKEKTDILKEMVASASTIQGYCDETVRDPNAVPKGDVARMLNAAWNIHDLARLMVKRPK